MGRNPTRPLPVHLERRRASMSGGTALLVLDLGTTHVKATLFTPEGTTIAQASVSYPTIAPRAGWAEQDPTLWWEATVLATREVLAGAAASNLQPSQVQAIGLTGQMHGLVPLDRGGAVLGPC